MGHRNYFKRGISFLARNGLRKTLNKGAERIARDRLEADYVPYHADEEELAYQRSHTFAKPYMFSILVPVHETDPDIFAKMLQSVGDQTYGNWELILADSSADETLKGVVLDFTQQYSIRCRDTFGGIHDKVRYIRTPQAKGISANTNEALKYAQGDYIALLDHDDVLENTALFDIMDTVENTGALLVYTDEDKTDETGSGYFDPHIKPGFDPVLLCTNNYICHFLAVKTDLAKSVGGFRPEYDGAQDHDFILRCTEGLRRDEIAHVPKVLYHWRSTRGSTSENPEAKLYAYEAGKKAVADHLKRKGISATVTDSPHLGFFDIEYDRLHRGVDTITPEEVYERTKGLAAADKGAICSADYLLVLSRDLKPLDPVYIADMMSAMRLDDIGAVTGKIIGRDKKVESAGFETGEDGVMKPSFAGLRQHFSGYMHRASIDRITKGFSDDCVLLRLDAVSSFYPKIVLKDGYDIYYMHKAVFRRKSR